MIGFLRKYLTKPKMNWSNEASEVYLMPLCSMVPGVCGHMPVHLSELCAKDSLDQCSNLVIDFIRIMEQMVITIHGLLLLEVLMALVLLCVISWLNKDLIIFNQSIKYKFYIDNILIIARNK